MRTTVLIFLLAALFGVTGCVSLGYYGQAISGQLSLLQKRRGIDMVLADPDTKDVLKDRLRLAEEVLQFAEAEIGLPVGDTFGSYVDVKRPFVVWNVFIAPEFSLDLAQHCFPIAGCVGYRGFFNESDARQFASDQAVAGFDVFVGGVAAYSTLGWFADPLLNTFIYRADTALAAIIFHELAHKLLYVEGDTTFNESFATAVERYSLSRWLESRLQTLDYAAHLASQRRRAEIVALIQTSKQHLQAVYSSGSTAIDKRSQKAAVVASMRADYEVIRASWQEGSEFSTWMQQDINNAKLGAVGAYHDWVSSFEELLAATAGFDEFVVEARALSRLEPEARRAELVRLSRINPAS